MTSKLIFFLSFEVADVRKTLQVCKRNVVHWQGGSNRRSNCMRQEVLRHCCQTLQHRQHAQKWLRSGLRYREEPTRLEKSDVEQRARATGDGQLRWFASCPLN